MGRDALSRETGADKIERGAVAQAIALAKVQGAEALTPDPFVAKFSATAESLKTTSKHLVLTMVVPWEERDELYRVIDQMPMAVQVTMESHI